MDIRVIWQMKVPASWAAVVTNRFSTPRKRNRRRIFGWMNFPSPLRKEGGTDR